MADVDSLTSLFVSIGIAEVTARDIARNKDLSTLFSSLADSSRLVTLNDPKLANVVLNLASTIPAPCLPYAPFLADYIVARKLASQDQLNGWFFYASKAISVGRLPGCLVVVSYEPLGSFDNAQRPTLSEKLQIRTSSKF